MPTRLRAFVLPDHLTATIGILREIKNKSDDIFLLKLWPSAASLPNDG
jgi:hypothetical protein